MKIDLRKILQKSIPSIEFNKLKESGELQELYPDIYNLIGKTQLEKYHPEGDAYNHTMQVLDEVSKITLRFNVRLAALLHDIGKSVTPIEKLPYHYNHTYLGLDIINKFKDKYNITNEEINLSLFTCKNHMKIRNMKKAGKIIDFINNLYDNNINASEFILIISKDIDKLPDILNKYVFRSLKDVSLNETLTRGEKAPIIYNIIKLHQRITHDIELINGFLNTKELGF